MTHLQSIRLRSSSNDPLPRSFPFDLPFVGTLRDETLNLSSPVTIFVGENGSGKSTLLEALASATELPAVGHIDLSIDATLAHARVLADELSLSWSGPRSRLGFFLRAEDFFGFARRMDTLRAEFEADVDRIRSNDALSDRARAFALQAPTREIGELRRRYGEGVDARSHGEQFLELFAGQIRGRGLYLLDEPEAPLSPHRQLSLISLIMHATRHDAAQFIIATHSPLLMAIPGAAIFSFDDTGIQPAQWESLEHVTLTRDFLNDPELFLRHL
ncbi:MAG: AAA family ATPase [Thermomicrobiales bacterium]